MKILNPRVHGYVDYAAVLLLALSPTLFGFMGTPAALCYVFAILLMGMSLMTAYPLGMAKVIPFTLHGGIEAVAAVFLFGSPWIFGFSELTVARNFFLAAAIGLGLVFALTNYKAADTAYNVRTPAYRRHGRMSFPSHPSFT